MPLKQTITEDMKDAMRARDTARLSTIRLLLAAIKQREVDERKDMTDADVLAIIDKMLKQRKDSIAQFEAGNRKDLADAERAEVTVLSAYQPAALSDAEIDAAIAAAIARDGRERPRRHGQGDGRTQAATRRPRRHGGRFRADQSQARGLSPPGPGLLAGLASAGFRRANPAYRQAASKMRGRPLFGRSRRPIIEGFPAVWRVRAVGPAAMSGRTRRCLHGPYPSR